MGKQRVFLTGATGGMGFASLKEMLKDSDKQDTATPLTGAFCNWLGRTLTIFLHPCGSGALHPG